MVFDFEPSGINDSCLRVRRGAGHCILYPAGVWNGLIRLNHLIASPAKAEPFLVFRMIDVGYDDGRFAWKGRAAAITASPPMLDLIVERGLATSEEADTLRVDDPPEHIGSFADATLMLRAMLGGASFQAIVTNGVVTGYALRTLGESAMFTLSAEDGVPVLDEAARSALHRQLAKGD